MRTSRLPAHCSSRLVERAFHVASVTLPELAATSLTTLVGASILVSPFVLPVRRAAICASVQRWLMLVSLCFLVLFMCLTMESPGGSCVFRLTSGMYEKPHWARSTHSL